MNDEQTKLQQGRHHDPFEYLGRHELGRWPGDPLLHAVC